MGGAVQHASIAAWNDEEHVRENRRFYVEKFKAAVPLLKQALEVEMPDASFYLWAKTPIDDKLYARRLYEKKASPSSRAVSLAGKSTVLIRAQATFASHW